MNVFDIGVIAAIGVIVFTIYFWIYEKAKKEYPVLGTVFDIANLVALVCAIMSVLFG